MWLKQSTAVTVKMGGFWDATDGTTAETALTIQKADVKLSKNGGAYAAASADQGTADAGAAYDANGYYNISLNTTDTGTLGRLKISILKAGALEVNREYLVVPANVYDSLVSGTDTLNADVTQWTGTNVATPDTAGYPKVTIKSGQGTGELYLVSGGVHFIGAIDSVSGTDIFNLVLSGGFFVLTDGITPVSLALRSDITNGVNVTSISGDSTAADNLEAAFDGTGYNVGAGQIVAASVAGSVGSVTGAVGSVTGAVGSVAGNVTVGGYASGQDPATLVLAGTVDTKTVSVILTELRAAVAGVVGVTDNGNSTYTLSFKKVDGTTESFARTYNPTTGART